MGPALVGIRNCPSLRRQSKHGMAWHQALPSGALCPAICICTITGRVVGGVKRGGISRISDIAGGAG